MGNKHSQLPNIESLNLTKTPVYSIGSHNDYDLNPQIDQKTLAKITTAKNEGTICKIKIVNKETLTYLSSISRGLLYLQAWKNQQQSLVLLKIGQTFKLKISLLSNIIRKEWDIKQNETIYMYINSKLCHQNDVIEFQQIKKGEKQNIIHIIYSHMEISG